VNEFIFKKSSPGLQLNGGKNGGNHEETFSTNGMPFYGSYK